MSFLAESKSGIAPIPKMCIRDRTFGIPLLALIWIILIVVSFLIIKYTCFGRNVFAIGSNTEAARLSGISDVYKRQVCDRCKHIFRISGDGAFSIYVGLRFQKASCIQKDEAS